MMSAKLCGWMQRDQVVFNSLFKENMKLTFSQIRWGCGGGGCNSQVKLSLNFKVLLSS